MSEEDFIILVYCLIEDSLKSLSLKLRSRGHKPKFTDAEVLTLEIVGEFLGLDQDKQAWSYFRRPFCWNIRQGVCNGLNANLIKLTAL